MKVRCTYHDLVQDKYNGSWYEPNKEYEVTAERGEELIASGYFVAVETDEISEEQVQAVASAIVKQAEEDNKTIEDIVNEIVEEQNEVETTEQKPKRKSKKSAE